MRAAGFLAIVTLMAAGCNYPAASGRPALPAPALGSPGAPGTSRSDLERTVRELEKRLASVPADAAAGLRLSEALLRQARVIGNAAPAVKAERVLRALLAQDTDRKRTALYLHQARRLLAAALSSQHKFPDAIREAERCLQERPDDAVAYGIIGDAKLALGDRQGGFAAFDRMMSMRPDEASYARIAYARELSGDLPGAIQVMSMALDATSPNDLEALAWHRARLGSVFLASGRLNDAARELDHAVHLFPDYPLAVEGQARVAHARGDQVGALRLLTSLESAPTSSSLDLAAEVLRALGRPEDATRKSALAEAMRVAEKAVVK